MSRLLLERATEVAKIKGWAKSRIYVPEYHWLSSTELLFIREVAPVEYQILRYDVPTGKETPLMALNVLFDQFRSGLGGIQPSPDGKRLLWAGKVGGEAAWLTATLEGTELRYWPRRVRKWRHDTTQWSWIHWMPDSSRCLDVHIDWDWQRRGWTARSWLRSLSAPEAAHPLPKIDLGDEDFHWYWGAFAGSQLILDSTKENEAAHHIYVSVWNLETGAQSLQESPILFPRGANKVTWTYSSQSRRIAWEVTTASMGPDSWVYKPLRSKDRPKEPTALQVWVSNLDGSHLTLVGEIPYLPGKENHQYECFGELAWLPDGERLSFVYYPSLYTVPVV